MRKIYKYHIVFWITSIVVIIGLFTGFHWVFGDFQSAIDKHSIVLDKNDSVTISDKERVDYSHLSEKYYFLENDPNNTGYVFVFDLNNSSYCLPVNKTVYQNHNAGDLYNINGLQMIDRKWLTGDG